MRQELVFISQDLDQQSMIKGLNKCLLTDEELNKGKKYWANLNDPFPEWK